MRVFFDWKWTFFALLLCGVGTVHAQAVENYLIEKEAAENALRKSLNVHGVRIYEHHLVEGEISEDGYLFRQKDFDAEGRLAKDVFLGQEGNVIFACTFEYDETGRKVGMQYQEPMTERIDPVQIDWKDGRMARQIRSYGEEVGADTSYYEYDEGGRLVKEDVRGGTELSRDFWVQYRYDSLGRLHQKVTSFPGYEKTSTFKYDEEGRVAQEIYVEFDGEVHLETGGKHFEYRRDGQVRKTIHYNRSEEIAFERRFSYIKSR
ncbi:MAG: hypothetical protein AAF570_02505 [Bacteroidota bacterium]